jgi:hypothetical protein
MFHWLRILNLSPSIYEKCVKSTVSNGKKFAAALMIFGDTALVCHQKFLSCRCKNRDFYRKFVRILHNPKKYIDLLKKFNAVIGPDFSQKIGYQPFVCFENSWWNKALSAYFQKEGIVVIPNVTWSTPASYSYAFSGLPKNSIIAINCTGIKSSSVSIYLWRKGYEQAIRILEPTLILRYGDVMPGEYTDISVYFENINLNNLRNGREWK